MPEIERVPKNEWSSQNASVWSAFPYIRLCLYQLYFYYQLYMILRILTLQPVEWPYCHNLLLDVFNGRCAQTQTFCLLKRVPSQISKRATLTKGIL